MAAENVGNSPTRQNSSNENKTPDQDNANSNRASGVSRQPSNRSNMSGTAAMTQSASQIEDSVPPLSRGLSQRSVLSKRRILLDNASGGNQSSEKIHNSRMSTRRNQVVGRHSRAISEATFGDDEWSDAERGKDHKRPLSFNTYKPPHSSRRSRNGMCSCIPDLSQPGIPSMLYDKTKCKHLQLTGYTHRNVRAFDDNWENPGKLPPIHQSDFVSRKNPIKLRMGYSVSMGYPPSAHGGARLAEEDADDEDDDDESYADSDDESEKEEDEEVNEEQIDTNKPDANGILNQFPYTPRAIVSEQRREDGYLAEDEIYDFTKNPYVQSRIKKGRGHTGKVFDPDFKLSKKTKRLKNYKQDDGFRPLLRRRQLEV